MVIKFNSRYKILFVVFLISLICLMIGLSNQKKSVLASLPVKEKIIVVDAGHGGLDGGASSIDGVVEKDINLNIAKYLESYLAQGGAKVVMTRTEDVSLHTNNNSSVKQKKREDLLKRREIANSSGGDMMISIHLNKFTESKYSGAQVFYETNFGESKTLASSVQNSLKNELNKDNKRVEMKIDKSKLQFQNLSLPSIIVECGFLSNPDETKLLNTPEYQQKVALSIYLGILNYYNGN
ncbi:MAG: N-acetylmuramoyl-L-alanine amidase CwlD [Clostridia bacterium]|nr:N-acetylmuramoyl-L-alanine amidase CwlD [Clostridia bacterium]